MVKNCKVSEKWFQRVDSLGYKNQMWLKKQEDHIAFCTICSKSINVYHSDYQAVEKHSQTELHLKNSRSKLEEKQLRLTSQLVNNNTEPEQGSIIDKKTLDMFCLKDSVTKAEIIWAMKNVICDMSAASCDNIAEVFQEMFPCETSAKFTLNRTKLRYYVTEAIAPYFKSKMLEELHRADSYSIAFDETTNFESKKELQVRVRYYSEESENIVTQHLQTYFIGTATAEVLVSYINRAIHDNSLIKRKMLMLGMDGPNVNKKVFRLLNEEVIGGERQQPLLDLGSCDLHIANNAFLKGLEEFGYDVQDFIIDIFYFFHYWPQRIEDFNDVQRELNLPTVKFIKHVNSRWLSLQESVERILQQWQAIRKYFLTYVPSKRKALLKTQKYKAITQALADKLLKVKLHFICHSATTFKSFTLFFQTDSPLIHVLYDELLALVTVLASKVCKNTDIDISNLASDIFKTNNLLDLEDIDIGTEATNILKGSGFTEKDRLIFYKGTQKHFIAASRHLLNKSSLNMGSFLKHCKCLNPYEILLSKQRSILRIAEKLPLNLNLTLVSDEWCQLKLENFENLLGDLTTKNTLISFWNKVFKITRPSDNLPKYLNLAKVVKACMSLSHGSADVERGFSRSKRVLSDDKTSMSLRTLNARLNIIGGLQKYHYKPQLVPITKELLQMARLAHRNYQIYLEEERKKVERSKEERLLNHKRIEEEKKILDQAVMEKKTLENLEFELNTRKQTVQEQNKAAEALVDEANKKLDAAIKSGNIHDVRIAQAMLDGYKKIKSKENEESSKMVKMEKRLNKRKTILIEKFVEVKKTKTVH